MPLIDSYGREHDYCISVTDRCNLRCIYCMGPEGVKQIPHREILTYEEILQIVVVGAELGIKKIRLTGGEPLVRKGLVSLVEGIARIPGISDISMTTNGILLPHYAAALKKAGLKRVNISLDSMKEKVFKEITRCGDLRAVQEGIKAALEVGLKPVKINTVLMKGLNHTEVPDFLRLAQEYPLYVRFIEYMPIGDHDREYRKRYLPLSYIEKTAAAMGLPLTPAARVLRAQGPAEPFALPGGRRHRADSPDQPSFLRFLQPAAPDRGRETERPASTGRRKSTVPGWATGGTAGAVPPGDALQGQTASHERLGTAWTG